MVGYSNDMSLPTSHVIGVLDKRRDISAKLCGPILAIFRAACQDDAFYFTLFREFVSVKKGNVSGRLCRATTVIALAVLTSASVGCGGKAVQPPSLDPQGAATKALELYDTDGDGLLSDTELKACPGLLTALKHNDADGDGQISADEISAKLEGVLSGGVGMISVRCYVTLKGRPVRGAHVRYVPEAFLGESVLTAEGTTDDTGLAKPMVSDEQLPQDQRGLESMQPGVYRVEITHPDLKLPARYGGEESPLGHDVDPTARGGDHAQFELSGK
jgi:hypothetical protein